MYKIRQILTSSSLVAAILAPLAAGAQAPGTWVLTPYAGAYLPSTDLTRFSAEAGDVSAAFKMKQNNALAVGGTANYWFAERLALEFGGAYAFSHVQGALRASGTDDGNFAGSASEKAYVLMGTSKLMFALLPPDRETQIRFGVGPAIIHRGGTAYASDADGKIDGLTSFGGAVSLCTRVPLTKRLSLRLRAEDFMYQAQLKFKDPDDPSSNFNFDSRFQNDVILSAGLQINLKR